VGDTRMNKFNKFIILAGLLFSFSVAYAEIKEVESLDTISKQILGENNTKSKKEKTKETQKKEVTKKETKRENENETEVKSENKASENEETVVNDIPDETATRVINKSEIVDFYEREVRDKIAYKEGSNTPFTGVFGIVIDDKIESYEEYKDGLLDGETAYFSKDKEVKLLSEMYSKGKLNGPQKTYYENGKLKSIVYYKNDRIDGIVEYDKSGKLLHKSIFENGTGDWKLYWSNGKVSEEGRYVSWKKDGVWKKYREDGSLDTILKYDNGRLLSEKWQ
jgi:hypothetical protein